MDKYKVILVDDEEEVIDVIERKIHWDMLGFDVVGSANNGVKALELVEKLQPDVVITDIKMPYMDGLELSRRLNNDYQNIHIIIFTGFDEFEYAKEAVHLEIKEYMLKPINAVELSECLTRLKDTLDKEREEKLNVKKLEDYMDWPKIEDLEYAECRNVEDVLGAAVVEDGILFRCFAVLYFILRRIMYRRGWIRCFCPCR